MSTCMAVRLLANGGCLGGEAVHVHFSCVYYCYQVKYTDSVYNASGSDATSGSEYGSPLAAPVVDVKRAAVSLAGAGRLDTPAGTLFS